MDVMIPSDTTSLPGELVIPRDARGLVLFAHGSGSGLHSPRNRHVAARLQRAGFATLLMDLVTREEDAAEGWSFDLSRLALRFRLATIWTSTLAAVSRLPIGYFGSSTGAAVALETCVDSGDRVAAVVSRGGRPDLAWDILGRVLVPTLLIVGSRDEEVLDLNRVSLERLAGPKRMEIVLGASHLFGEPETLDEAAGLAVDWFLRYVAKEAAMA